MSALPVVIALPPMTQLNAPYPSLAQLTAWMRHRSHRVHPCDLSLGLALRIFDADGIRRLLGAIDFDAADAATRSVLIQRERYARLAPLILRFLQGRETAAAGGLVRQALLPLGPRFAVCDDDAEAEAFGFAGISDQARWLSTLFIQDLADCYRSNLSPHFALTSYGEALAESASTFDPLAAHLATEPDAIESELLALLPTSIATDTRLLALTVPFPGNLPSALRIAQWCRRERPDCVIALGGGYPSTELRDLREPRLFDLIDHVILDDGEGPLAALAAGLDATTVAVPRSLHRLDGVVHASDASAADPPFASLPAPDYSDLNLDRYLDLIDTWNPMHRLWNEGRWLGIMAAHGCYWRRCSFCDVELPYIRDYRPVRAKILADRLDAIHAATGAHGFHFVDEAAPPQILVGLALELLRRGRTYQWWGNIRFDPGFTADRCRLLAAAGMVAVSGGIEVAEDEVLERIGKGVSVDQAARVTAAFAGAGMLVHGYLMYGFPGQSAQQTVDSLEIVRQMMAARILHSGFWHRFTVTAHSPVGRDPAGFGIRITGPPFAGFARNNLEHEDPDGADHAALAPGLNRALQAYMSGEGLEESVRSWFGISVPKPRQHPDRVVRVIANESTEPAADGRMVWLGGDCAVVGKGLLIADEVGDTVTVPCERASAEAWAAQLRRCSPTYWQDEEPPRWRDCRRDALLPIFRERGLVVV